MEDEEERWADNNEYSDYDAEEEEADYETDYDSEEEEYYSTYNPIKNEDEED